MGRTPCNLQIDKRLLTMERRMRGNSLVRCGVGENPEEAMSGYATHCNQKITYHYPMQPRRFAQVLTAAMLRLWARKLLI